MNEITGESISYQSINPISFYFKKRKEGISNGFAVVMTILHFLPRFQKEPEISVYYQKLTGKKPTSIREFIASELLFEEEFFNRVYTTTEPYLK